MYYAINLNKDITCDYLCQKIQKLINEYKQTLDQQKDIVLTINVSVPTEYEPKTEVKLLELKNIH